MIALIIHAEDIGLTVSLHTTEDDAFQALRDYLVHVPVSYHEPLPQDASNDDIGDQANDRSQFMWSMPDVEVPGARTTTEWGFRHPGFPHVGVGPHVETRNVGMSHDTGPYSERDARYFAQGRPVVKRTRTTFPDVVGEWEDA